MQFGWFAWVDFKNVKNHALVSVYRAIEALVSFTSTSNTFLTLKNPQRKTGTKSALSTRFIIYFCHFYRVMRKKPSPPPFPPPKPGFALNPEFMGRERQKVHTLVGDGWFLNFCHAAFIFHLCGSIFFSFYLALSLRMPPRALC